MISKIKSQQYIDNTFHDIINQVPEVDAVETSQEPTFDFKNDTETTPLLDNHIPDDSEIDFRNFNDFSDDLTDIMIGG